MRVVQSFLTFDSMDRTLSKVLPVIGKLLSSTSLCCCLYFNFIQFVILENLFGKYSQAHIYLFHVWIIDVQKNHTNRPR